MKSLDHKPDEAYALEAIAAKIAADRPDLYLAVTGLPIWWDQVGREYSAANRKWKRWVKARLAETEILKEPS